MTVSGLWAEYRQGFKRRQTWRRLFVRALRARRDLIPVEDRSRSIATGDILSFGTMRNEMRRLPHFLSHHRALGVGHFLIVDNGSDDGTTAYLAAQPDVSVWQARGSYRASRFGMDWMNALLMRHGRGHWCLTLDADELLVYPRHDEGRDLRALTADLTARGARAMAALMLDLYPKGPLSQAPLHDDPTLSLRWYDPLGYDWQRQPRYRNISIRGGVRQRVFFADRPDHAPHLHKVPLVRWNWGDLYVSSTHVALPARLNHGFDARLGLPTGVLLHTKFLDVAIEKSREEKRRAEHFTHADRYDRYYDAIIADPDLWHDGSAELAGWRDLVARGLMQDG